MLNIDLQVTGDPLASWETHLRRIDSVFRSDRPFLRKTSDVLQHEHTEMFDRGYRDPDNPWPDMSSYWAEHLAGHSGRTGTWTGEGKKSISTRIKGDSVEVRGADYLGRFQFGPFEFKERFGYRKTGPDRDDWEKLPPSRESEATAFRTKTINIRPRVMFAVLPQDIDQVMYELGQDIGGMEYRPTGGSSVFR